MSRILTETVWCPRCSARQTGRVALSVNGQRSPHLRDQILAGTFQVTDCAGCHQPFWIANPFLYVDLERKLWFAVGSPLDEAAWRQWEVEPFRTQALAFGDEAPEQARALGLDLVLRTVFGLPALREKLVAEAAGIDDRWLEVLKASLAASEHEGVGDRVLRLVAVEDDELVFVLHDPMAMPEAWPQEPVRRVPSGALEDLAGDPAGWEALVQELSKGPFVDLRRLFVRSADPEEAQSPSRSTACSNQSFAKRAAGNTRPV